jgi:PKD repeat protein
MTGGTSVHWNMDGRFRDRFGRNFGLARAAQLGLAVVLALVLTGPAVSAAPGARSHNDPVASFTFSPSEPVEGELVTFTSTSTDPNQDIQSITWDLDDDSSSFNDGRGTTASKRYDCEADDHDGGPPPCTITARVRVEDEDENVRIASRSFTVKANSPPTASFTADPESPETSQPFTLTSTSSDPDGRPVTERWDTDDNGSYDATGRQITLDFDEEGVYRIHLQVTDSGGTDRTTFRDITVRNPPPKASFEWSPEVPVAGEEVVFTSTSTSRDDEIVEYEWDLDGDGQFNDGDGPEARRSFGEPGTYTVGLRVTDDDGKSSAAFETIEVAPRPAPPPQNLAAPGPAPAPAAAPGTGNALGGLIAPFPSVRIRGVTTVTGARIDLLSVRTPGGTRVLVRCKGRDCPWRRKLLRARFGANVVRVLRVPGFKRRRVRAGTVIEIFVIAQGRIGKYTRFRIRRLNMAPIRVDRCTARGAARVRRCPA